MNRRRLGYNRFHHDDFSSVPPQFTLTFSHLRHVLWNHIPISSHDRTFLTVPDFIAHVMLGEGTGISKRKELTSIPRKVDDEEKIRGMDKYRRGSRKKSKDDRDPNIIKKRHLIISCICFKIVFN